jgi:hypothetical protein
MPIELFKKLNILIDQTPLHYHQTNIYKSKTTHVYRGEFLFSLYLNVFKFRTSNNLYVYNISPELYIDNYSISFELSKAYTTLCKKQISNDLNNILKSKGDLIVENISKIKAENILKLNDLNKCNDYIDSHFEKFMIFI